MVCPVVMYGCESWTIKKTECQRIDAFKVCAGEDSWESLGLQANQTSQSQRKTTLNIHWKDGCWSWHSNTLAAWCEEWLTGKDPDVGEDWRQEEKGVAEDEMVGWHHRFNGHEFEQTLGNSEGQGSLACCSAWSHKESDRTYQLKEIGSVKFRIKVRWKYQSYKC